jgi:hypothetical protein
MTTTRTRIKPVPSPYQEFTKAYGEECKRKGRKFNLAECGRLWKEQKGTFSQALAEPRPAEKAEKSMPQAIAAPRIEVEAQPSMQVVAEAPGVAAPVDPNAPAVPGQVMPGSPVVQIPDRLDEYKHMAGALHELEKGVLEMVTKGAVSIDDDTMEQLNHAGARLIMKYDTSGAVAEYGPEITYIAAQTAVVIQYFQARKTIAARQHAEAHLPPPPEKAITAAVSTRTDTKPDDLPWGEK